jgi:GT2 family glycosyltransferase
LSRLFPRSRCLAAYHQGWKDLNEIHDIDACSGAALLVRTACLSKVGYLDERFFMYGEDLDWCRRFREAGYRVVYYPNMVLIHHKYQSGLAGHQQQLRSTTRYYFYDSMLAYYEKYYHTCATTRLVRKALRKRYVR